MMPAEKPSLIQEGAKVHGAVTLLKVERQRQNSRKFSSTKLTGDEEQLHRSDQRAEMLRE
jgi:hypothetical protein